jgi:dethiobiotin synthetase
MIRAHSVFIAGTDTGIGKTHVAVQLLRLQAAAGLRVAGMKPVAAGATHGADGWRNDDALALASASNVELPYELLNPVCLPLATSPHLAARAAATVIDTGVIVHAFREIARRADVVVVEGAGGWLAPIGETTTMQDVALALDLPVVLVVGLRLGCISHALLTQQAISACGLELEGWVANAIEPAFDPGGDYLRALEERLAAPLLTPWSRSASR